MSWILENKEWLFSGAGVIAVVGALKLFFSKDDSIEPDNNNTNNIEINVEGARINTKEDDVTVVNKKTLDEYKNETRIVFVDDDARFKVAKILTNSGWVHTKLIKDCKTLEEHEVVDAKILFIDVQGVGVAMGFSDEGLGLALAIKGKYPSKKVIIYSAETQGDRFHEALRKADSFLPKNADPYEFQRIVEEYTVGMES